MPSPSKSLSASLIHVSPKSHKPSESVSVPSSEVLNVPEAQSSHPS